MSFIVRSYNKERLEENLSVQGFTLSATDIQKLDSIAVQRRFVHGQWLIQLECGLFRSLEDLWGK